MIAFLFLLALALNIFALTRYSAMFSSQALAYEEQKRILQHKLAVTNSSPDGSIQGQPVQPSKVNKSIEYLEHRIEVSRQRAALFERTINRVGFFVSNAVFMIGTATIWSIVYNFLYYAEDDWTTTGTDEEGWAHTIQWYKLAEAREGADYFFTLLGLLAGTGVAFLVLMVICSAVRRSLGIRRDDIKTAHHTIWLFLYSSVAFILPLALLHWLWASGWINGTEVVFLVTFLYLGVYFYFYPSFTLTTLIMASEDRQHYTTGELAKAFLTRRPPLRKGLEQSQPG